MMHSGQDVDFRSYRHIFTNANQGAPRDNIRLGFESKYRDEVFNAGEYNYFHFPLVPKDFEYKDDIRYTSGLPINDAGLREDGAVCGYAPYCSDRVYMNNVGYEWKDSGGGAVPKSLNNGVWLCAWLSGDLINPSGAVWMDRWYDPEIITKDEALRHRPQDSPGVIDSPSRMVFKYGCQYKYYRVSKDDISEVVRDSDAEGLLLHIDQWSASGCKNSVEKTSATPITNVGFVEDSMFNSCEVFRGSGDYGISFNGKSCVQVDSDAINSTAEGEFSVVAFIRHDDWKNSNGCAIIDRGFHGGWEIGAYPYPHNGLICVLGEEKQTGRETIGIYGPAFDLISVSRLPEGKHIYNAVVDDEYYIWALRDTDIVKIDLNGNVTYSIPLPDEVLADTGKGLNNTRMQMLGGEYYGNVAVAFSGTKNEGSEGDRQYRHFLAVDTVGSRINSNLTGKEEIITSSGNLNRSVDSRMSWLEIDTGKYKDFATRIRTWDEPDELTGDPLLQMDEGEIPIDIKVDSDYNIFVLTKKYQTQEDLDGNYYVEIDEDTGEYKGEYGSRLLKFVKDLDGSFYRKAAIELEWSQYGKPMGIVISAYGKDGEHRTLVNMVMDNGEVIRYNQDLVKMWTTNISYRSSNIRLVVNGYEWGRRFLNNAVYARVTLADDKELLVENNGKKFLLSFPMSEVSDYDWHQLALVRSRDSIRIAYDCRTKSEVFLSGAEKTWMVSSLSDPAIVIGGEVGVGAALSKEHLLTGLFWDGMIDDFRLYDISLSNQDLCYIHMFKYDIYPLYWNMEIYDKYHIEAIRMFYKMKMPGSKSQTYDIVVNGFAKDDDASGEFSLLKDDLRRAIGDSLPKISPTYAQNREVIFNGKNTVAKWK